MKVTRGGQEESFLGELHIDPQILRLAGVSLFGTTLFNLQFDGRHLETEPARAALDPDILVAMLELAIADPRQLQSRLHGLTLQVKETGGREIRELTDGGRMLVHIEDRGSPLAETAIEMDIPSRDISVQITPLDTTAGGS